MSIHSYKNYLLKLREKTKPSLYKKILTLSAITLFIILGIFSALAYYKYRVEPFEKARIQYLDIASGGFNSTKDSLEDILVSFKVAGEKVDVINSQKESTGSASGFSVILDDITKTILKIESTQKNILFQKKLLQEKLVPPQYSELNINLVNYYQNSETLLTQIYNEHLFLKEIFTATGSNFYSNNITNEFLWRGGNKEDIINYYKNTKLQANATLENLSKLDVPDDFRNYYNLQISYLELIVKISDNVIGILNQEDEKNPDNATQIEKAYQLVIGARRQNETLTTQLLAERLKLVNLKQNFAKFATIKISQKSVEDQIADIETEETQKTILETLHFWGVYK